MQSVVFAFLAGGVVLALQADSAVNVWSTCCGSVPNLIAA